MKIYRLLSIINKILGQDLVTEKYSDKKLQNKINIITEGIGQSRVLKIEYFNTRGQCMIRAIEPYELILRHGGWYLFSYNLQEKDMGTFKVNRISTVVITNRYFNKKNLNEMHKNYN